MSKSLTWDEKKRLTNLAKHGLDFQQAHYVLDSQLRLDTASMRNNELRIQSFAYVFNYLTTLSLVYLEQENCYRIISFRHASQVEKEQYNQWLANEFNGEHE
ncbi:hypothetical protein A4G19_11755 [Pasteurellaceae bacterium Macca]|nr:hypothetical protein [Pasteurellaceae bacterium Macca]